MRRSAFVLAAAALITAPSSAQNLSVDAHGNAAPARFAERPGSVEFSGRMIVRPKQEIFGQDPARFDGGGIVAPGVVNRVPLTSARARLMPNVVEHFADVDEYVVRVPEGMNENTYAEQLLATGDYQYAEPDWICYQTAIPNDPSFGSQWHFNNINAQAGWDIETGDPSIIIAIVDSGIDIDHPDFQNLLVPGFNAVTNLAEVNGGLTDDSQTNFGHGSFCAGMAAAEGNNGAVATGVAWNCSLMSIKVTVGNGITASSADLNQGARWAADNGARVVNVSFSGVASASVQTTGAYVEGLGGVYFRSSGNDGQNMGTFDHNNVVVVGATTISDARAGFSNFGVGLDLVAPGLNVRCSSLGGGTTISTGTSFSTPCAAGLAALILSANPSLSPTEVKNFMFNTAVDLGSPGEDDFFGKGLIDVAAALQAATGFCPAVSVSADPADLSVCAGAEASFAVEADGNGIDYLWTGPGGEFLGSDASIDLGVVDASDAGVYACRITNSCGEFAERTATLVVNAATTVTDQPDSQTVDEGQTAVFSVTASGDALTYTWFGPNGFIAEFSDTLTINNVSQDDAGDYVVTVAGACGFESSDIATLTVNATGDCPADVNGDGNADPADFTAWLGCFNNPASAPFCDRADVNTSGAIDPSDFTAWLAAFQAGCP